MTGDGTSLRLHALVGVALVVGVFGGFLAWGALAEIAGAVVAPGRIVVESEVKRVQHLEGGIIGEIHARDGDRVEAGDLLARMDATQPRASLGIIESQATALAFRRARLIAERDHLPAPADRPAAPGPALEAWAAEARILQALRETRDGEIAQLREQIAQAGRNVEGQELQIAAKGRDWS